MFSTIFSELHQKCEKVHISPKTGFRGFFCLQGPRALVTNSVAGSGAANGASVARISDVRVVRVWCLSLWRACGGAGPPARRPDAWRGIPETYPAFGGLAAQTPRAPTKLDLTKLDLTKLDLTKLDLNKSDLTKLDIRVAGGTELWGGVRCQPPLNPLKTYYCH